jgi:peptide/nickel transport system ATP-binding protein
VSLLQLNNLRVRYGARAALHDITLHVAAGETLGLLGESGSGKSTLGRTALRLQPSAGGDIRFDGTDITHVSGRRLAPYRRRMQMVFQDPMAALNARQTIGTLLEKPLAVQGLKHAERGTVVAQALDRVSLPQSILTRHPHTLSGGQLQRVVIARALAMKPELVVCDEAVSALDVSVQAQILNLLVELKRDHGLTYLFISHDLAVVRYMADRVAVMFKGRIVEIAEHEQIWRAPRHPYTQALVGGSPTQAGVVRDPPESRAGNVPAEITGCAYRLRCPLALDRCAEAVPVLKSVSVGHQIACHAVTANDPGAADL